MKAGDAAAPVWRLLMASSLATVLFLGVASASPFILALLLSSVLGFEDELPGPLIVVLLGLIILTFVLGGAGWGVSLARLAGRPERGRLAARAGGLAFGIGTFAAGFLLLPLESAAARLWRGLPLHVHFALLWVVALLAVTTLSGLAVGGAIGDRRLGQRLALLGTLGAVAGFLAADMALLGLGLKVGGGNAAMVKVALAGNLTAALGGGAMVGWALAAGVRPRGDPTAEPGPLRR